MQSFTYHRDLKPLATALLAVSALEIAGLHLLVAVWSLRLALTLTAAGLAGIVAGVALFRSFARRPVLAGPEGVRVRLGWLVDRWIPRDAIAALRTGHDLGEVRSREVLKAAVLIYPNVRIELAAPIMWRKRAVRAVAMRLDDPMGFLAALR